MQRRVYYNIFSEKVKLFLKNTTFEQLFVMLLRNNYVNFHAKYAYSSPSRPQHIVKKLQNDYFGPAKTQPDLPSGNLVKKPVFFLHRD
jgi:hypothetical protein